MVARLSSISVKKEDLSLRVFPRLKTRFVLCLLLLFATLPSQALDWQWSGVDRAVVIGDIHGAFAAFVDILKHTSVMDDKLDWQGGTTHLVIDGDILDRGPGSRQVMELIMKLEPQAEAAGGMVHLVLGNHEVMNLTGDLRYVSKEEFTSYADDEDPAYREAALARFRNNQSENVDDESLINKFNNKYPPGFFGHQKLFSAGGRYGRWLAGKPVMVKINDTLFVHGGLSQQVQGTTGNDLNSAYAKLLHEYLADWAVLSSAGVLPMESDFYDQSSILKAYLEQQAASGETANGNITDAAKQLIALNNSPLLGPDAVIWYRGNVLCNEVMAESELDNALQQFGAARLVVGHTPTYNRRVLSRFHGKLIRADTGILKSHYGGQSSAVIIDHGKVSALYPKQNGLLKPDAQARMTGVRIDSLADDELEKVLSNAQIKSTEKESDGSRLLQLEYGGELINARFVPAVNQRKNNVFVPEVAAYRLDRLLGIDLVPVTVLRDVDGKLGAITVSQASLINERQRQEEKLGAGAWCPLQDQFNLMYVFDTLVYNEGRTAEEIWYTRDNWQLLLTGNRRLFAAKSNKPRYLANAPLTLPDRLLDRLKTLDSAGLAAQLGDVLDAKRRHALLNRRDLLLLSNSGN